MSNSAGSPSTLWRLRPVIYGAAQNYIASETSTQPRIINTTPKHLKQIGYRPRTMIGFWNVRTLLEEGSQTHQNSRFLQLENIFTQYGLSILGVSETRWAGSVVYQSPTEGVNRASAVGLMISNKTYEALLNWQSVSDRIISARLAVK